MAVSNPAVESLSGSQRELLKFWLQEFEASWDSHALLARVSRLPPSTSPLRRAALIELVKIDLARRWERGDRITVDAYLRRYPEIGNAANAPVDLVEAEYNAREKARDTAGIDDLARRYPQQIEYFRSPPEPQAAPTDSSTDYNTRPVVAEKIETEAMPSRLVEGTPASLPERFGRYQILRRIGGGGMGTVYLAHDTGLDRQIALKVPHYTPADAPKVLERFRREARAAARLMPDKRFCPIYDVGDVNGVPYLTMEFISGSTLENLIKEGKQISQKRAAAIVRDLALALDYAHGKGVIHRDLKPSNVMVNEADSPVVMDFGLAKRISAPGTAPIGDERLTQSGAVMGSPHYMSPEQVRGDVAAVGPPCDIYTLGVILYELVTLRVPFNGALGVILTSILTEEPAPPSRHRADIHPALERIIQKAMAKLIENRFATMAELAAALNRYLGIQVAKPVVGQSVPPGQATTGPWKVEKRSKRRTWIWLGGAIALGLAAGAVYLILTN